MLRIAICDDDGSFLSQIHTKISAWNPTVERLIIDTFDNGDSLIHTHTRFPYDIIFFIKKQRGTNKFLFLY